MFCIKCGSKNDEDSKFCQNCGRKVLDFAIDKSSKIDMPMIDVGFYSEDWRRIRVFTIVSLPYFDVMIDKDNLYLIELPKYNSQTFGLFLGLFLFNIIGAIIGSSIGSSSDTKKRKNYRSVWLDSDNKIISRDYDKDIFLKFPLKNLKDNLVFKKNKFILMNGEQKIILKKNQKECGRFSKFVENYVLQKLW